MAGKGWNEKKNPDFKTASSTPSDAFVLFTSGWKHARIGRAGPGGYFKDLV